MKTLISVSLLNASMDAQFAMLGLSAKSWTVAVIKAACKSAGLKSTQLSDDELREKIAVCFSYLTKKGCPPCTKDGVMMDNDAVKMCARHALHTLNGADAARKAEAKAAAAQAAKDALEQASKRSGGALPDTPTGDGKAALNAMGADSKRLQRIIATAEQHRGNPDKAIREVMIFILDQYMATM